jgi:hypothetical protein
MVRYNIGMQCNGNSKPSHCGRERAPRLWNSKHSHDHRNLTSVYSDGGLRLHRSGAGKRCCN